MYVDSNFGSTKTIHANSHCDATGVPANIVWERVRAAWMLNNNHSFLLLQFVTIRHGYLHFPLLLLLLLLVVVSPQNKVEAVIIIVIIGVEVVTRFLVLLSRVAAVPVKAATHAHQAGLSSSIASAGCAGRMRFGFVVLLACCLGML